MDPTVPVAAPKSSPVYRSVQFLFHSPIPDQQPRTKILSPVVRGKYGKKTRLKGLGYLRYFFNAATLSSMPIRLELERSLADGFTPQGRSYFNNQKHRICAEPAQILHLACPHVTKK